MSLHRRPAPSAGAFGAMQALARPERHAIDHRERAALFAAGQLQFLPARQCADQEYQVLETDPRGLHELAVDLEGLAQQFAAREAGQRLPVERRPCAWQHAQQATDAGQQRAFLLQLRRSREECRLSRRLAARPGQGRAGTAKIAVVKLGILFKLHDI
jgi:hypothetical protein